MAPAGLEVPVFGFKSGAAALIQGARRLELNQSGSYPLGGTTPSLAELTMAMGYVVSAYSHVAVRAMIRPRGPPPSPDPDFIYSDAEFLEMRSAIEEFKRSGLLRADKGDGFVFGILRIADATAEGSRLVVDTERNAELVQLARPFQCVFHRAFDDAIGSSSSASASDTWNQALDDIHRCGFHGILTSGGPGNAPNNAAVLTELVVKAEGKLEIIAGGGVRSTNVRALAEKVTGGAESRTSVWFHSSCLTAADGSEDVDREEVKSIVHELNSR
ncbi:hypothetical protein GQ53DRAFT_749833 [Thozetella sp. PMI_491]|nr:hypothetical protein GQ53DRAFT_749833 [Thozetella sp. PMI_491]